MRRPIPTACAHLILRGVFLMTQAELDWFYGGGAGQFWPDLWARFAGLIPEDERDDLIAAYHRRLFSGDLMTGNPVCAGLGGVGKRAGLDRQRAARAAKARRNTRAPLRGWKTTISPTPGFLSEDGQILATWPTILRTFPASSFRGAMT